MAKISNIKGYTNSAVTLVIVLMPLHFCHYSIAYSVNTSWIPYGHIIQGDRKIFLLITCRD